LRVDVFCFAADFFACSPPMPLEAAVPAGFEVFFFFATGLATATGVGDLAVAVFLGGALAGAFFLAAFLTTVFLPAG